MILGPSYKLPTAEEAYANIKRGTKRVVLKYTDIISQGSAELADKKVYMQQPAFWENELNKKMYEIGKELGDIVAGGGNRAKEFICRANMKKVMFTSLLKRIGK